MSKQLNTTIKEVLNELANDLETGNLDSKPKIGLTIDGSEHGLETMHQAVKLAQSQQLFDIVVIGTAVDWAGVEVVATTCEADNYQKMEELLAKGYIQGCVTLHYPFPIGVSTVGRVVTPALGKEMFISTTTGTTSSNRNEAMVLNAINGIVAAKAAGIEQPTLGILNVDGANSVERALKTLANNGYPITFSESHRSDGGVIMRGNDLLFGSVDVMVCDSLTGNILMKMFSAFQTGGNYEATGYGYGPGIGEGYEETVLIISRASGATVIANALMYAYQMVQGQLVAISKQEYALANRAKLKEVRQSLQAKTAVVAESVVAPDKEVVTVEISGIDVIALEDAVTCLWQAGIYAESGMGCTGPIVLVNEQNVTQSREVLVKAEFL
ncbi:glycine reductase [Vagococcus sp. BWB3-3]|uniref:Glycine reductase n=1 Tax=Vagococcus allomyrinae TaxID=2794353 RepID=A0A940PG10_9ENTE|nr:glycine/sarcosine/betaine reductase complex component C subunit alpha [Vagococcus allomyrinae]MBP1044184.1 glycine reductase [Vagococcus allomyrinae]